MMGPSTSVRTGIYVLSVLLAAQCLISVAASENADKKNTVANKESLQENIPADQVKRTLSENTNQVSEDKEEKRSPYARYIGSKDDKRSPYAKFMGSNNKRSPYAKFMGSNTDDKRSPYAKFMGSTAGDKRSPYAKFIKESSEDKRSPYAGFMGSNVDDKRSPYAKFMGTSSDDKRSPYAKFMGSSAEDKRSPYARFMKESSEDKRSPYAGFMGSNGDDKRSPYAKFMGTSSDDKRSPYAGFMGSNVDDKRSPYAKFMGSSEDKRSPYAKFLSESSEDKRSPYGQYMRMMAGDKRSPYARYIGQNVDDKRSPYGQYMGMMTDDKRSPYAKFMNHKEEDDEEKRSPGFRKMYLGGGSPKSIYDLQVDDTNNIAQGLRGPTAEQLSDNGLIETIDGLKETDKFSDKRRPSHAGVLVKSQEDSIDLPPAMMQALLKKPESEVENEIGAMEHASRTKRSALMYGDKRTPYAGFREIMARNRELPVSRLRPAPGYKRNFVALNDVSNKMDFGMDGKSWSDSLSVPRFSGSFRKRRSTDDVIREKRSPGFRSMKLDSEDDEKRSPGFRFMKWQSNPEDEETADKRSPGFRHMRLPEEEERPARYRGMNLLEVLEKELDNEKRSPGFRSMQPNYFEELEGDDDNSSNEITKRLFIHPAAFHKQLYYTHRRYRG